MKIFLAITFTLMQWTVLKAQADKPYAQNISDAAMKVAKAMEKNDWEEVIAMTYPDLVKRAGGERKMMQQAIRSQRELEQQGFSIDKAEISEITQVVEGEKIFLAVIPIRLTFDGPRGDLYSESGLIGVSEDEGQTWTFISIAQTDMNDILKLFPELSKELNLPRKRVYQD